MSVSDVLSRISEIQSTIAQIQTGQPVSAGSDSSSASDTATAADFASALAAAGSTSSDRTSTDAASSSLASELATLTGSSGTTAATAATGSTDAVDAAATTASAANPVGGVVRTGVTGADVLADAKKYLGVPYVFGGTTRSGMDCSGLVQTVFKDLGVTMPRVVPDQANMGVSVPSLAAAKPGDLVVEKGSGHIQIYAGNGMILEAPRPGENVVLRKEWLSADQIGTIRRIVPSTAVTTTNQTSQSDLVTAALQQLMSSGASA